MNAGKRLEVVEGIDPIPFARSDYETLRILDVRNPVEWESGIIKGATLISLPELNAKLDKLDKQAHYYVHCAGGYRSMMAASLLKKNGFQQVTNVRGGINKLKACGIMLTSAVLK
jgi:rhodanese-related sulfurtransferase